MIKILNIAFNIRIACSYMFWSLECNEFKEV